MSAKVSAVQVFARVRPVDQHAAACVHCSADAKSIAVKPAESAAAAAGNSFAFDRVFDGACDQQQVYDFAVKPIVDGVLDGFNGAVIAYGQTGSGKTHTMLGDCADAKMQGMIPRAVAAIFQYIHLADPDLRFTIEVSFLEIYNEQLRDLLGEQRPQQQQQQQSKKLTVVNNSKGLVEVKGLTQESLFDESRFFELYHRASRFRSVSATDMNEASSRSHFVATLRLSTLLPDGSERSGTLHLVDLAGSERIGKTRVEGATLEEAKKINGSLHVLGNVINALTTSSNGKTAAHVPYRDSVLTRVLRDALGGNSRTCLLLTVSALEFNQGETVSTLRFGQRAKMINNRVEANIVRSAAFLENEILRLARRNCSLENRVDQLQALLQAHGIEIPRAAAASEEPPPPLGASDYWPPPADLQEKCADLQEKLCAAEAALAEKTTELSHLRSLLSSQKKQSGPLLAVERTTTTADSADSLAAFEEEADEDEEEEDKAAADETCSCSSSTEGLPRREEQREQREQRLPDKTATALHEDEGLARILQEMQKLKSLWEGGNEKAQKRKIQVQQLKAENVRLHATVGRLKASNEELAAKYHTLIEHAADALPLSLNYAHLVLDDTAAKPRFANMLKGGGGGASHSSSVSSSSEQALRKWGRALLNKSRTFLAVVPRHVYDDSSGSTASEDRHPPSAASAASAPAASLAAVVPAASDADSLQRC